MNIDQIIQKDYEAIKELRKKAKEDVLTVVAKTIRKTLKEQGLNYSVSELKEKLFLNFLQSISGHIKKSITLGESKANAIVRN